MKKYRIIISILCLLIFKNIDVNAEPMPFPNTMPNSTYSSNGYLKFTMQDGMNTMFYVAYPKTTTSKYYDSGTNTLGIMLYNTGANEVWVYNKVTNSWSTPPYQYIAKEFISGFIKRTEISGTIPIYDINASEIIYTPPPIEINGSPEWAIITNPTEGYKTSGKFIIYMCSMRIKQPTETTGLINYTNTNLNGLPLSEDINIKSANIYNMNKVQDGEYTYATYQIHVEYKTTILGNQGIKIKIENSNKSRVVIGTRTIQLIAFTDANNDGIDDTTGDKPYIPGEMIPNEGILSKMPTRNDYSNDISGTLQFTMDTILYFIKIPFEFIGNIFTSISKFISSANNWLGDSSKGVIGFFISLFSFLPNEISIILTGLLSFTVIFSIFKMFRR